MRTSAARGGVFPSPGMSEVVGSLSRGSGRKVLDLGPADEVTLSFLGGLHLEVQVADLEPEPGGKVSLPSFPDGAFRVVLGWDLLVRLKTDGRRALAAAAVRWLAPGGTLFLVLPLSAGVPAFTYRFRIRGPSRLEYRPSRTLARGPVPTTREVLDLFRDLECSGARILRHGAREFVLRRPTDSP